jgi:hypothetical protein
MFTTAYGPQADVRTTLALPRQSRIVAPNTRSTAGTYWAHPIKNIDHLYPIVLTRLSGPRSRPTISEKIW